MSASGPGADSISPDGSTLRADTRGLVSLPATNFTSLGFPSSIVDLAG